MVILECPTKVPGRLQVVLDRLWIIIMRLQNQQNMKAEILTENRSTGSGISKNPKIVFFQTCMKIIPGDPLHTLKARKHLKHVFELDFDR